MKNNNHLFLSFLVLFFLSSCNGFEDEVLPLVGTYEAHVQGVTGPFSMNISIDRGDDIFIEAPFDGFEWVILEADIDNEQDDLKDIDINRQDIGNGISIKGGGFYLDGSFQLDYTIDFNGDKVDFIMIGSKI